MATQPTEETSTRASLELLYNISRELSSALDLRTVLRRVLFLSMRNIGATSGSIIVLDEMENPVESAIIVGDVIHNQTTQRLRSTIEHGLAGWVARSRQAALVLDTSLDERWLARTYENDQQFGPKSVVSAPLLTRDVLVGVITLVQLSPGYFTQEHLALVQAIADQAANAVLNARLYHDSQHQAELMTALAQSASKISASLNLDDVLHDILEQTSQTLNAQAVSLALIDPQDGDLVFRAASGGVGYSVINVRLSMGKGIAGWVAQEGEGLIVQDVSKDERYDPEVEKLTGLATHAIACAPIQYRNQVIGIIEAVNPAGGYFEQDALLLLSGIGGLAGTAIRHAQLFQQLQAAHQSYRELFENSIDPILITNWDGLILEVNRQAITASDYSRDGLFGMDIAALFNQPIDVLGAGFENLRDDATYDYETKLCTRSGHEVPIQVCVRQVRLDSAPRIQWILRDITERKKLDTLRDDLISMIYHDLRSPLANVVSSLDVLHTMLAQEEERELKPLMEIALRSTTRIQRLTDSLLDMSRLEAGHEIGNRQPSDARLILQEAVDTVEPVILNKEQTIRTDIPGELPFVLVDPDMIRRVAINLLENAAKFTQQGGTILLGACRDDKMLRIWVEDNGPGIPASEHERIFDKFSRLKLSESVKGMGLGLAYCRLAVQGHGGKIWVESEPGLGSRFIFVVPIAE
jgi:NtrC-family two-component system sensor histidine kinase KinB